MDPLLTDLAEKTVDIASGFRECPCFFYDQPALAEKNDRAQGCRSRLVCHTQVKLLKPDNGEFFFSEYLLQQRQVKRILRSMSHII